MKNQYLLKDAREKLNHYVPDGCRILRAEMRHFARAAVVEARKYRRSRA
jgi:hypothetical protein